MEEAERFWAPRRETSPGLWGGLGQFGRCHPGAKSELCVLGHGEGMTLQIEGTTRGPRESGWERKGGTKPCAGLLMGKRGPDSRKGHTGVGSQVSDGEFSTNTSLSYVEGPECRHWPLRGWDVGSVRVLSPHSDRPKTRQGLRSWVYPDRLLECLSSYWI